MNGMQDDAPSSSRSETLGNAKPQSSNSNRAWQILAPLKHPRRFAAAAVVVVNTNNDSSSETQQQEQQLVVMGGQSELHGRMQCLASAEIFDNQKNQWRFMPNEMATARFGCAAVTKGDKVYALGGEGENGVLLASMHVWQEGTWHKCANLPAKRTFFAAAAVGPCLFVFGGRDASFRKCDTVVVYHTDADTWRKGRRMPCARAAFCAVAISPKIYLVGGDDTNRGTATTMDVFDATTEQWETTSESPIRLPTHRESCSAVALANRYILITGGYHPAKGYLASMDLYDTQTRQWIASAPSDSQEWSLNHARASHISAVVGDCVIVAGGYSDHPEQTRFTESMEVSKLLQHLVPSPVSVASVGNLKTTSFNSEPELDVPVESEPDMAVEPDIAVGSDPIGTTDFHGTEQPPNVYVPWLHPPLKKQEPNMAVPSNPPVQLEPSMNMPMAPEPLDNLVAPQHDPTADTAKAAPSNRPKPHTKHQPFVRFLSDVEKGNDLLGAELVAIALADTLSLKDLTPPFCAAILGGWGSGKSFMFGLMQERLADIQEMDLRGRKASQVGHLYTVKFNAWTFAKGNLWASLMYSILSHLSVQLDLEAKIREHAKEILMQGVSLIRILDQLSREETQYLVDQFDDASLVEKINQAIANRSNVTEAFVRACDEEYGEIKERKERKSLERDRVQAEYNDLKQEYEQGLAAYQARECNEKALLSTIESMRWTRVFPLLESARAHYYYHNQMKNPPSIDVMVSQLPWSQKFPKLIWAGDLSSMWVLVAGLVIGVAVVIHQFLDDIAMVTKNIIAGLGSILPVIGLVTLKASNGLEKVAPAVTMFMEKRRQLENETMDVESQSDLGAKLSQNLRDYRKWVDAQKAAVDEKEQVLASIETDIADLKEKSWMMAGDPIDVLVRTRLQSDDYVDQLGVVHKAQEDLRSMSHAFLNHKDKAELFPRGEPRVVLFIDDMDRCPPEQVVQVLEAIQLLVKTELFVVVMAVDARYMTLSLEQAYPGILHPDRPPSGLDYLEKTIQLPYRVPSIDEAVAMDHYVGTQMGSMKVDEVEDEEERELSMGTESAQNRDSTMAPTDVTPLRHQLNDRSTNTDDVSNNLTRSQQQATKQEKIETDMENLAFTSREHGLLSQACLAARVSPRSVKRIINVFRILKQLWAKNTTPSIPLQTVCLWMLAMCASTHDSVRRTMCQVLLQVEDDRILPADAVAGNLQSLVEIVVTFTGGKSAALASCLHEVGPILGQIRWGTQEEWAQVRHELVLIRSFSLVTDNNS